MPTAFATAVAVASTSVTLLRATPTRTTARSVTSGRAVAVEDRRAPRGRSIGPCRGAGRR